MLPSIFHPRLYTFYKSSVLNLASIGTALSLLLMDYTRFNIIAVLSGALFFAILIAYALWFWLGKSKKIPTSKFLSDISSYYALYTLIVLLISPSSNLWLAIAVIAAIVALMFFIIKIPATTDTSAE